MEHSSQKYLFCFGFGYSCDFLANMIMHTDMWRIAGTTRNPEKKALMKDNSVKAFLFDRDTPLADASHFLNDVTHLLISAPPNDEGDPVIEMHERDLIKIPNLEWIGYLSSTSVYGNHDGDWVDETVSVQPNTKRGSRRQLAEQQWMDLYHRHNLPVHIFRLAGIYGPGRSAIDSVRTGAARRIFKEGHAFSRIHVEDIGHIILASMNDPKPGRIYNVCDDNPAPSHEVIAYACDLLDMPRPPLIPFEDADMAPMARSFYSDNKRVRNDFVKKDLNLQLRYPDFKKGLEACLAYETDQTIMLQVEHDGPGAAYNSSE